MKTLRNILVLSFLSLLLFGIAYPLAMTAVGQAIAPNAADGKPIYRNDQLVGFENIGQNFKSSQYFWGRPSAVDYDASSTGGSNYGPTNPEFLALVQHRIDTLMAYHPSIKKSEIPVELVTASGSGLDPHISNEAALLQVNRIAKQRNLSKEELKNLVDEHTEGALFGIAGPENYVNVLKLNLSLDELEKNSKK
ncbi:potassium-transporting ATPase subunit C [Christiangramia fulva]|uniref:Potassium-transporting ATPase KdpC subunit n=1 Tax=Christiangramia fulva TaxID=2126553 RepID=A0A2R3Z4H6_9FLAO|nr:potassium-transporting ATPase subunit KdpC [Christiangramia fulva]AVR45183.1 potassium-transporting ATPase subunit C [Christiangramia fulva]